MTMKKSHFLQRLLVCMMAFLTAGLSGASVMSTYALSAETLDRYAANNILFYDPSGGGNCGYGAGMVSGDNQNYAGDVIFSEENLKAIEANRPFYEKSAEKYGFPWQILAVIHMREHSLIRSNPENGQGAYQLYSYTDGGTNEKAFKPAGAISDEEFQRQTDIAADVIRGKASGLDLSTDAGIKKLFFKYNSASSAYVNQGIALGFSEADASNGEGSPYVMNRVDEKRDPTREPTKSNNTWGQIKTDNGSMSYPANSDFGAFVYYIALGGTISSTGSVCTSFAGGNLNLNDTAIGLAWPENQRGEAKHSPTNAYSEAMKATWVSSSEKSTVQNGGFYRNGTSVWIPVGKSCDNFVGTVVRYSGIDPNFPIWLGGQKGYLASSPNWQRVSVSGSEDARPGDIRIENDEGHIVMVVEVNGSLKIASASSGQRFGDIQAYYPARGSITYRLRQ